MHAVRKPWWQQATALVTVSTGGVITGFTFVPGATATMTSPTSMPLHLLALEKAAKPADAGATSDAALRSAIVNVANYYLQLAKTRTPAQMEALIWSRDSLDGVDHGESCAAFASLTLELAAQAVGQQSWVDGGSTYPWPLHDWADVRVDPNPDSLGITSLLQDAEAHNRWHALGDGYVPQPGDWVLFDGHVEVVTSYSAGVLDTIGADSLPNFTVNAHSFPDPLAAQGVVGFVDNGRLGGAAASGQGSQVSRGSGSAQSSASGGARAAGGAAAGAGAQPGAVDIPGATAPTAMAEGAAPIPGAAPAGAATAGGAAVSVPAAPAASARGGDDQVSAMAAKASAVVPGVIAPVTATQLGGQANAGSVAGGAGSASPSSSASPSYRKYSAPSTTQAPGTKAQQAFINEIAPGAIAAQQRYGVPAAVTLAQAIEESAWGSSGLAVQYNNLFGIKGSGPAGSVTLPTQEYEGGQWVTIDAQFRVYHNIAESIADHAELLATSGYYQRAMADRAVPDAFANDLTGVYATDPDYGSNLIALMRLYNLYRFDSPGAAQQDTPPVARTPAASPGHAAAPAPVGLAAIPGATAPAPSAMPSTPSGGASSPAPTVSPSATPTPSVTLTAPTAPGPSATPSSSAAASPSMTPSPSGTASPSVSASPSATAVPSGTQAPATGPAPATSGTPAASATPAPQVSPAASAAVPGIGPVYGRAAGAAVSAPDLGAAVPGTSSFQGGTATVGQAAVPGIGGATMPGAAPFAASAVIRGYPPAPQHAQTLAATTAWPGAPSVAAPAAWPGTASVAAPAAWPGARVPGVIAPQAPRYQAQLPPAVATAFFASAKAPLARSELLYRDVAGQAGIRWELLAACDWMQCQAHPRYSPVHGERIGTLNADGTVYMTKSEALAQCASDLIELAGAVYRIDLTARAILSVGALADAFAAFRWGGLLKRHRVSAMEFPYSVAGLTSQHLKMHWPVINDSDAPDKPGGRCRLAFGAVPVVLSLNYPATV